MRKELGRGLSLELVRKPRLKSTLLKRNSSVFSSTPSGVRGSGGIRAAAGHNRTSRGAWPCIPLLWAAGAGPQPGCSRTLCSQGGGPALFHTLGPGLAVRES